MAFFFMLVLSVLSACDKDGKEAAEPGVVNLHFKAVFGEEPLQMFERSYAYEDGMEVKFQLFNFYLTDAALLESDKAEGETLFDVELVSYEDILDEGAAREGVSFRIPDVPPGRYESLRLGLGLNEELNATQPGDYAIGHPLTDNFWSWAMGYIFFKIEGNADLNGDGEFTEKLTFHIGGDDFYHHLDFPGSIEVPSGGETDVVFEVDLRRVLVDGKGSYLDFRKTTIDHTNDLELAAFLADNFSEAIHMK